MREACENCKLAGNLPACQGTKCAVHDSWYATMLKDRINDLEEYVLVDTTCPYCEETEKCLDDCTLSTDGNAVDEYKRMVRAREALKR